MDDRRYCSGYIDGSALYRDYMEIRFCLTPVLLSPGKEYKFTIYDWQSDGICCGEYGNGWYKVRSENNDILVTGGEYLGMESKIFVVPSDIASTAPPTDPTTPNPTTSPSTSPGPPPSFCFSGDTIVHVLHKGPVAMKDLQVGDMVLALHQNYEPVYAFGHYAPEELAQFLKIKTDDGISLEITAKNLVFVEGKTNPIHADAVTKGSILKGASGLPNRKSLVVTDVSTIQKVGAYAPLTASGTLVLGQGMIQASSYISLQDKSSEFVELWDGRTIKALPHHTFVHMALTPFRIMCHMGGGHNLVCQSYSDEEYMPSYVARGIDLVKYLEALLLPFVVQIVLLGVFGLVCSFLMVMEAVLFSPWMSLLFCLAAAAANLRRTRMSRIRKTSKTKVQ
jgi:hypothetical protein